MRDLDELFEALKGSTFRSRFRLRPAELAYLRAKGLGIVLEHAAGFIGERLAPARPINEGRQTPMAHHPVFVAQHATATCCRACLAKWHFIPQGRPLTAVEKAHILSVLERWLRQAFCSPRPQAQAESQLRLFE